MSREEAADSSRQADPRIPLGLLFVMLAVFFRLSRYTRQSLIGLGETSDVVIDIEAYKLMMLIPLGFVVLAALQWPRKTRLRFDTGLKLLVALFVFATASLLWAYNPTYALPWLLRIAIPISVYFLVINYTTKDDHLRYWAYMFVLMGLTDAVIAAVELPFLFRLWGGAKAADKEILGYIGIYARWAVIGFAFSLHHLAFGASRRETIYGLVGSVLSLITVYFTFRRAALLAAATVVFLYMGLIGRRQRAFLMFAVIAAVLMAAFLLADPRYAHRMASMGEASNLASVTGGDVRRVIQFLMGVQIFREHWLLGIGTGNLMIYSKEVFGTGKWLPHNIYLEFGSELGIIGLGIFLALVGVALRRAWGAYRMSIDLGDLRRASLVSAIIAALVSMLLYGFFQPIRHDFYIYVMSALCSLAWDFARARTAAAAADPPTEAATPC